MNDVEETGVETPAEEEVKPQSINELKRKMKLTGVVTRLELYGAFIDLGLEVNGLIHISQLGKERVNRVSDVLSEGQEVDVWVDKVDPEREQIMLTMIEPLAVEWQDLQVGQAHNGVVSRLENFGAFVNIGAEREGLVHISELSHDYVKHPSEVVKVGDEVTAQVLGFSKRKRRIDLSMKALQEKPESAQQSAPAEEIYYDDVEDDVEELPTAMEIALREAMGDDMPVRDSRRSRKGKKGKKRRSRERMREQQDDIMNRTLQN